VAEAFTEAAVRRLAASWWSLGRLELAAIWLHLSALHAVAMEFALRCERPRDFYLSRLAALATGPGFAYLAASAILTVVFATAMLTWSRRPRRRAQVVAPLGASSAA
jgi:hypothetical protein